MFGKDELKKLQDKIDDLSDKIDTISSKQNSQFTDILLQLKETRDEIETNNEKIKDFADGDEEGTEDSLYERAKEIVIEYQSASSSLLQRKLGIGYSHAAKLIDTLESEEVIGPVFGSTPRKVLISATEK